MTSDGNTFYLVGAYTSSTNASTLNATPLEGTPPYGSVLAVGLLATMDLGSRVLTYLGPREEIDNGFETVGSAVAPDGSLILAFSQPGQQSYPSFPVSAPVRSIGGVSNSGYLGVVLDLNFSSEKSPLLTSVVNPASLLASSLSPGQVIEVRGVGLGPGPSPVKASDSANPPLTLGGTQLMVNGVATPLLSVADNTIMAALPNSTFAANTSTIQVTYNSNQSIAATVATAPANPALFTSSDTGEGQAVAFNEDGSLNSPGKPIHKGQVLGLLATGLGTTSGSGGAATPTDPITATVAGIPAQVISVTPAAGYPAGYWEVNVTVPSGAPEGDLILVSISVDGTASQQGVTISVR